MQFTPEFAERRFGYGLSPVVEPAPTINAILDGVLAPDEMRARFPIEPYSVFQGRMLESQLRRKELRKIRGTPQAKVLQKEMRVMQKHARQAKAHWFTQTLARRVYTRQAFFERLVYFWGDHFTAHGKAGIMRRATSPYLEEAIRPNVTFRFADLLKAAVTHPLMVHYLDQERSIGPGSKRAGNASRKLGLNENLAREVLELHTLGVGGPYSQADVRQLAELLTGLTYSFTEGRKFRKDLSEPGAEMVMGRSYGPEPGLQPILAVLDDLAAHPATAAHVARKLAVHFVSDTPDPALVARLTEVYLRRDGALMPIYEALLRHPSSWQTERMNIRQPVEFMSAAARALAVPEGRLSQLNEKQVQEYFYKPLIRMGQHWQLPNGPDGWTENDAEWMTPQGLAERISWAMHVPTRILTDLPDPRDFARVALGETLPGAVEFAASAAESRAEAIGLVLTAPAFQRR